MSKNVILLSVAQTWAKKWRDENPDQVKAFLIPNVDIKELMGLTSSEGDSYDVRAYLGIDETDLKNSPKLMMVAVDSKGQDLIDENNGYFIYDFTKPCPQICDDTSPLFNL